MRALEPKSAEELAIYIDSILNEYAVGYSQGQCHRLAARMTKAYAENPEYFESLVESGTDRLELFEEAKW